MPPITARFPSHTGALSHQTHADTVGTQLQASQTTVTDLEKEVEISKLRLQQVQNSKKQLQADLAESLTASRKRDEERQDAVAHLQSQVETLQKDLHRNTEELQQEHAELQRERSEKTVLKGMMEDAKMDTDARIELLGVSSAAKEKAFADLIAQLHHTQEERQQLKLALKEAREMLALVEAEHEKQMLSLEHGMHSKMEEAVESTRATAATAAETSATVAAGQTQHFERTVQELEERVAAAGKEAGKKAAEAEKAASLLKALATEKLRALSQDMKRGLLALHDCSYKTESSVTEVEVEVAKYSTHVYNAHRLELAALEQQLLATSSQAKMAQQKLALKAMRTEEDFKTQTQLLAAQLNQKEQALVELREAKSTSASAMQEKLTVLRCNE